MDAGQPRSTQLRGWVIASIILSEEWKAEELRASSSAGASGPSRSSGRCGAYTFVQRNGSVSYFPAAACQIPKVAGAEGCSPGGFLRDCTPPASRASGCAAHLTSLTRVA